ncbi:MAG: hypothetical protein J0I09_14015 [Sphingobacteriia bacterium]|nr:hypothetical protein [Sphingobacteriia bacterium]
MKYLLLILSIVFSLSFISCYHKKPQKPVVKVDTTPPPPPAEPDVYVPFTRELFYKLRAYNIDIRKVQFFVDQQIVLSRYLDQTSASVTAGVVKFMSGKTVNEIVIPQYTPCVVDSVDTDGLRISFERGSLNIFKFINSRNSVYPENYVFAGTNWKDGGADVLYDKQVYRATCGTCNSVAEVRLAIKQSDVDKADKKTKVLSGRKVDGY